MLIFAKQIWKKNLGSRTAAEGKQISCRGRRCSCGLQKEDAYPPRHCLNLLWFLSWVPYTGAVHGLKWCHFRLKTCHFSSSLFLASSWSAFALLPTAFWDIRALSDSFSSRVAWGFRWSPVMLDSWWWAGGLACQNRSNTSFRPCSEPTRLRSLQR